MEWIVVLTQVLHQAGITLGVGASTFALIFYIQGLRDGEMDASERRFLHSVFFVIRIGMGLILATLAAYAVLLTMLDVPFSAIQPPYFMEWTILAVIFGNAILMTLRKMPMWLGPTLAGGSWYSLFFVNALPLAGISYGLIFGGYIVFLLVFLGAFNGLKARLVPAQKPAAPSASSEEHERESPTQ